MPDGFVRGQFLDLVNGRLGPAPQILHRHWPEGHSSSAHCVPHLVLFPPVGLVGRVARFLSATVDDVCLQGSSDCNIKAQVLTIVAGKWDQEIGRSSVEARKEERCLPSWVEASGLGKPDEALLKRIVFI